MSSKNGCSVEEIITQKYDLRLKGGNISFEKRMPRYAIFLENTSFLGQNCDGKICFGNEPYLMNGRLIDPLFK